jgi:hypothetical protein
VRSLHARLVVSRGRLDPASPGPTASGTAGSCTRPASRAPDLSSDGPATEPGGRVDASSGANSVLTLDEAVEALDRAYARRDEPEIDRLDVLVLEAMTRLGIVRHQTSGGVKVNRVPYGQPTLSGRRVAFG